MKTEERQRAGELRVAGWSVKEIERHLGVSRSSVSKWVGDIDLSPAAQARLATRTRLGPIVAARRKAERARARRSEYQEEGRRRARELGADYAAGCALFWAEGARERNVVKITNSDPELLGLFFEFLQAHFGVEPADVVIRCNLFAESDLERTGIETFWLEHLGLPMTSLRKSTVNVHSKYSLKKRTNKLPYGTCTLIVYSTRIAQNLYGSIQELGGFDRPSWLD